MARKAEYITKLKATDEKLCKLLKYTQHISREQANKIGVKNHRLENFCKQGIMRKINYVEKGKMQTAYELTKSGRTFINKNFTHLRGSFYTTSSAAVRHNLRLSEIAQRELQQGRELLNERDLKEYLLSHINSLDNDLERSRLIYAYEHREISVPDIGIINENGIIECYEVINDNYTAQVLECKANFSEATGINITYIKQ